MSNDKTAMIPFNRLTTSPANVRRTNRAAGIEALAASIAVQGVLQNLVVSPADGGLYAVHAGNRRFQALGLLVEQGKRPANFAVPCKVIEPGNATAASLAENVMREAMHAADEFEAFQKLTSEGFTIDFIADAFGVTPLVVERRMRLANAAPALIEEFRADQITTDQMIALCATDDHDRQVEVWNRCKNFQWMRDAKSLRKAVLAEGELDVSNDPRIPFIGGLVAYKEAGGEVRKDLFTGDGSGGFITDEPLLDKLVADKLEEHAEAVRAEGWGWVELWPAFDHTALQRLGAAPKALGEIPDAERATLDELRAKLAAVEDEVRQLHAVTDDYTEEESDRLDELYDLMNDELPEQIAAVEKKYEVWAPDLRALAGAVVALYNGALRIERGLVRAADRKAVAAAAGDDDAVKGGRETESAGRKADALSDALRRSLLGHRNLAAQQATAERPDVAKVLLACSMVQHIRSRVGGGYRGLGAPCDYVIGRDGYGGTRTHHPITDEAGNATDKAFREACIDMAKKLPEAEGKLWDALAAMKPAVLDKIIAYGVALSVSLFTDNDGLTGKFFAALNFDMSEHFTPTADNYLGRVSKRLVIEALTEAGKLTGDADKAALLAMKKGALAAEAEKRLAGSGWVPTVIRTPKRKAPAKPKATQTAVKAPAPKAAAKKAPAKAPAPKQVAAAA